MSDARDDQPDERRPDDRQQGGQHRGEQQQSAQQPSERQTGKQQAGPQQDGAQQGGAQQPGERQDTAAPSDTASGFRLRPPPPRVTRLSSNVVIAGTVFAIVAIVGALGYGLSGSQNTGTTQTHDNTQNRPQAENFSNLPKTYAGVRRTVPKLGKPLAGDLGPPIVSAGNARTQKAQTLAQETDAARTSRLFIHTDQHAQSPVESVPSAPPVGMIKAAAGRSAAGAPTHQGATQQDRNTAFLDAPLDRHSVSPDRLVRPASPYLVQAGTVIPAALITGIRSDLPGLITAQVTQAVYDSVSGRVLLIPQGSRLIGQYRSSVSFGQNRILLVWTRLILPNGASIMLERLPGVDPQGYAGLEDQVDNHWGMLFKGAVLSTILSVGAEAGTSNSENNLAQAIRMGASNSISQTGQSIVQRELDIPPTLTIRPGFPVDVLVAHDLVLAPYTQEHKQWQN